MLRNAFFEIGGVYSADQVLTELLWREIDQCYTAKNRHYHNLAHLENLLAQLEQVRSQVEDWSTLLFTLYYHDAVYNALKKDNEEESALLAEQRLHQLGVPATSIARCTSQILATKSHHLSRDNDTNLFTDADLSILGSEPNAYAMYAQQVRKEYSIYPDIIYKAGRKKVLQHFLAMPQIFKTKHFIDKFEQQARINLQAESQQL